MNTIESFAEIVREFRLWVMEPSEGAAGCRETLSRLLTLYTAALELPPAHNRVLSEEPLDLEPNREEVGRVVDTISKNLPIQNYWFMFNPCARSNEEPVAASIGEDIGDIYRDVIGGLFLYDSGATAEALWSWSFSFQTHWGRHAVSAIQAIHCYLADDAQDTLSSI